MPELPEVETICRGLGDLVTGRTVTEARSHPSPKFTPAVEMVGETFTALKRRGKYLIFSTDGDLEFVAHLGMTGTFVPDATDHTTHVRAWWRFDDDHCLAFRDVRRFGRLRVVPAGDYRSIATLHHLGPEPLGDSFTPRQFHRALQQSSRAVKTQLLSQRPVAGIGNIYADEALWMAGISPVRRQVGRERAERLHDAIRTVIGQAVENGGTTLRDYRTVDGDRGSNQYHLQCYGRGDEPCLRCGQMLAVRTIDARTTTWCRTCQR